MYVDSELTKLLVQLIVRLVVEIGWEIIKLQRTQARDGRRQMSQRQTRRAATQRITRRRRRARLADRQKTLTRERMDEEAASD